MERPIEKLNQLQKGINKEHKDLMIERDILQSNINRMMVTNDHEELLTQFAYAHDRLGKLFWANRKRINMENIKNENDD